MHRISILGTFMLFACCMGPDMTNSTSIKSVPPTKSHWDKICEGISRRRSRVDSLHADVAAFVATYSMPPHYVSLKVKHFHKHRRISPASGWTRVTKLTSKTTFVIKRTYPLPRQRRDVMFAHFLNVFSLFNSSLREELMAQKIEPGQSRCYWKVHHVFMKHCFYEYFEDGGDSKIKTMLARACSAPWMSARRITRILRACCQKRFKFELFRLKRPPRNYMHHVDI